jgi:hypothetical protein
MYKKGDWVFCEFKLQEILEVEENRVTSVHDGWFEMGSLDLSDRCFPLTVRNKVISDSFKNFSDQVHAIRNNGLNYPDINRYLISKWVDCCEETNDEKIQKVYIEIEEFIDKLKDIHLDLKINGINVFRQ